MQNHEKTLKEIGLTNAEAKVLIELYKVDSATVSDLAEQTKIYRTNIYDILESLITKGLVSYITKANKRYFQASKPQKLLEVVKEKEARLQQQEKEVQSLVNNLLTLNKAKKEELRAEIYQGKEGLKTLLNNILNEQKDYACFGYSAVSEKILPIFFKHWHKQRIKLKIKRRLLAKEQMRNTLAVKIPLTETRYIQDEYNTPISIMIYGDKVWVLIPSGNENISLLVESKKLAQSLLNSFEQLWKIAKR